MVFVEAATLRSTVRLRQMSADFISSYCTGMTLVVEEDEIADVVNVGLLRFQAEVFEPDRLEQTRGLGLSHCQMMQQF